MGGSSLQNRCSKFTYNKWFIAFSHIDKIYARAISFLFWIVNDCLYNFTDVSTKINIFDLSLDSNADTIGGTISIKFWNEDDDDDNDDDGDDNGDNDGDCGGEYGIEDGGNKRPDSSSRSILSLDDAWSGI